MIAALALTDPVLSIAQDLRERASHRCGALPRIGETHPVSIHQSLRPALTFSSEAWPHAGP